MKYLIDTKNSPPVVVLQVREGSAVGAFDVHHITAQQYADQTGHVLVWSDGPDAVLTPTADGIVHPTAAPPAPAQQPLPVAGLGVPPAATKAHAVPLSVGVASLWTWLEDEVKQVEPAAVQALETLLTSLLTKLVAKV